MKRVSFILLPLVALSGCAAGLEMQDIRPTGLDLTCSGSGSRWETSTSYENRRGSDGERSGYSTSDRVPFSGVVRFAETASGPMINLPEGLLPQININGGGRWREVKDMTKTDALLTGRVSTGGLATEAEFAINRRTGDITVEGATSRYTGVCTAATAGGAPRF